ncbi:MAG: hypothetical protein ACRDKH_06090 [Solirubrobacterales bacterium]
MAAARWTDLPERASRELIRDLRGLRGPERTAVLGVALIVGSLVLPWYDAGVGDLVQTGLGGFTFAEAAILLTCVATVFLSLKVGGGYVPPRPLTEWGLFAAAGIWAALIVIYRMLDPPALELDLPIADLEREYGLGWGIFVALGGAGVIVLAGIRSRGLARRRVGREDRRDYE